MIATSGNACGPQALASTHGPSTDVERGGRLTRHDAKETTDGPDLKALPTEPTGRQITWVNIETGRAARYMMSASLPAMHSSLDLADDARRLLEDEAYPAAYNSALAVIVASQIVEHGTAKTVPTRLAELLLQEIDRQSCLISAQLRQIRDLSAVRALEKPSTM